MTDQIEFAQNLGTIWFSLGYSKAILERIVAAHQRERTQRTLRQLDEHLLRDIGVDPVEIGKPSHEAKQLLSRIYLRFPG